MKLSTAQIKVLRTMPCSVTTWGGKPIGGDLPSGVGLSSVCGLIRRGLVVAGKREAFTTEYHLTANGKRVLAEIDGGSNGAQP